MADRGQRRDASGSPVHDRSGARAHRWQHALLYDEQFLFTGDHLWWDPESGTLESPQRLVWSERHLRDSIAKLLQINFEWVLAGHGGRIRLPVAAMHEHLRALLERRGALRRAAESAGT